jgi:hypothetical protein
MIAGSVPAPPPPLPFPPPPRVSSDVQTMQIAQRGWFSYGCGARRVLQQMSWQTFVILSLNADVPMMAVSPRSIVEISSS